MTDVGMPLTSHEAEAILGPVGNGDGGGLEETDDAGSKLGLCVDKQGCVTLVDFLDWCVMVC